MRVAVTGATGLVGRRLVNALLQGGHSVITLSRRSGGLPRVPVVEWAAGTPFPADALGPCDAIVHLAGEPLTNLPWTTKTRRLILESRTLTTQAIVAAMEKGPWRPRVYLQASAIGFYGDGGEEVLSEGSARGKGFLADVCDAWEAASADVPSLGVRRVVLRFGLVLDSGGGILGRILPMARAGLLAPLGSGRQWVSWIHGSSLTALLLAALHDEEYSGIGNAVAPEPVRQGDFSRLLAKRLRRPLMPAVPALVLRSVLGEASTLFLFSQRVRSTHLPAGFSFEISDVGRALELELAQNGKVD